MPNSPERLADFLKGNLAVGFLRRTAFLGVLKRGSIYVPQINVGAGYYLIHTSIVARF